MSFTDGFKKEAGALGAIGGALGSIGKGISSAAKGVKSVFKPRNIEKGIGEMAEGYRGAQGKSLAGERLGLARVERENMARQAAGKPRLSPGEASELKVKTHEDVLRRTQKYRDFKNETKPSFAKRHPVLTGIGTYGAMQMAFGGGDKEEGRQPPPVMYQGY